MSSSVSPTQLPSQSSPSGLGRSPLETSLLGTGIIGLFIQGVETGLVFAQLSRWFSIHDRGGPVLSFVVIFVTVVGLAQTGVCVASAWDKYVQRFGLDLRPDWEDVIQVIPTHVIALPVQALMIRRCYYLVSKNMYIITPLVLFLVASVVMASWSLCLLFHYVTLTPEEEWGRLPQIVGLIWPYSLSLLLPSILDLILTGILLCYLTRTKKQVYAPKKRKLITRLVNIVWQSALPPTLCAICVFVFYIIFSTKPKIILETWFPIVQAMIGKLYVLSLLHMINAQPLQADDRHIPDERPTTFISSFTIPTEIMYTITRNARVGDDSCGELTAEHGPVRTLEFAV